jgi:hypothetical protein
MRHSEPHPNHPGSAEPVPARRTNGRFRLGDLRYEPHPDGGSIFVVTLPETAEPSA